MICGRHGLLFCVSCVMVMYMTEKLTKNRRSWLMRRVQPRHTKPELIIRSFLHRCGFRFSLHRQDLPGKPDIVMTKYQTVIFVHGCFWHRHPGCKRASSPQSHRKYWKDKFARNVARDENDRRKLQKMGWKVIVVWECEAMTDPRQALERIVHVAAPSRTCNIDYSTLPDRNEIMHLAEAKVQWRLKQPKT